MTSKTCNSSKRKKRKTTNYQYQEQKRENPTNTKRINKIPKFNAHNSTNQEL